MPASNDSFGALSFHVIIDEVQTKLFPAKVRTRDDSLRTELLDMRGHHVLSSDVSAL